jgi:hypothetical protein
MIAWILAQFEIINGPRLLFIVVCENRSPVARSASAIAHSRPVTVCHEICAVFARGECYSETPREEQTDARVSIMKLKEKDAMHIFHSMPMMEPARQG